MERYQRWFYEYEVTFLNISENVCGQTLQAYRNVTSAYGKLNPCYYHADCVMENLSETRKANMASAGVILGLMPSLLASLAPSISETSALSLDAPLLSLLISLGVPAVYPTRVLEYNDPFKVLVEYSQPGALDDVVARLGRALDVIAYVVCLGAIANNWVAALDLCFRAVLSWGCINWYMPLVWVLLPVVVHLVAAIPFALVFRRNGSRSHRPWWLVFSNCASGVMAFLHLALGTFIMSSLLFVPINDALSTVSRFVLSAFACRVVFVLKLALISKPLRVEPPMMASSSKPSAVKKPRAVSQDQDVGQSP